MVRIYYGSVQIKWNVGENVREKLRSWAACLWEVFLWAKGCILCLSLLLCCLAAWCSLPKFPELEQQRPLRISVGTEQHPDRQHTGMPIQNHRRAEFNHRIVRPGGVARREVGHFLISSECVSPIISASFWSTDLWNVVLAASDGYSQILCCLSPTLSAVSTFICGIFSHVLCFTNCGYTNWSKCIWWYDAVMLCIIGVPLQTGDLLDTPVVILVPVSFLLYVLIIFV